MALNVPPATIGFTPRDHAIEVRLNDVLMQFCLAGNFFRVTANGGVLEKRDSPLELGEEYFLVTQRRLPLPTPGSLEVSQERSDRSWTAYRLRLRDDPTARDDDIGELGSYLEREIVPARPRVDVVWPPPNRFDPDGTRVHGTAVSHLIVRSSSGAPKCETANLGGAEVVALGGDLYRIDFKIRDGEAAVWLQEGPVKRLRFEDTELLQPEGVRLRSDNELVELYAPEASHVAQSSGRIEVLVPTERLWRRLRADRLPLRPIPNGYSHGFDGPVRDLDAGAFGRVQAHPRVTGVDPWSLWCSHFETLVVGIVGPAAARRLGSVHTKRQLVRWAVENRAQSLLPLMLSVFSTEVDRGIS